MKTDSELLQQYAGSRSEEAFTELVRRHINFVYSAALRQVGGDGHLAQDVAQSVFIDLARKARSVSARAVLTGWLYTSTRYAAAKAVRSEQRRHAREEEACLMEELSRDPAPEPGWEQLQPVLDEAMHDLQERDRNALLLRYFEGRQLAEVGLQLGLTEDAARMRIGRALDKLRELLARRGVTSSTAALTALLGTQTVGAAPAGLALNVAGAALASTASSTFTLFNIMATTKLKIAVISAAIMAVATPFALQYRAQVDLRQQNQALRQQTEHLAGLTAENARLSNLLAQAANSGAPAPDERAIELLKLRGEVARLREESRELARLKSGGTSSEGQDSSIESTLRTLGARATQLKRHLEQMPERGIPELRLIGDKEWIDAVAKTRLETDEEYRQALNSLRSGAKQKFGNMMQKALKQYAVANDGMLPSNLAQLQPYLDPPIDPSIFQRYQLGKSGRLADVADQGHNLINEIAPPIDDEYDTTYSFGLNGTSTRSINQTISALESATRAYARANNGLLPREPGHLAPYLQQPVDPGRVQKYFNTWPPNVATLDQLQVLRR